MSKLGPNSYRSLLLDLDGTLLVLDMEKFIPAYIEALSSKFIDMISQNNFSQHLFGATNAMVQNLDPEKNNETVFYKEFYRRTGLSYKQIKPILDEFYQYDFPALSFWGSEHPRSQAVIEAAQKKKMNLVLATNPIFPSKAILERLSWSGLSADQFQLVTTMENMHFCKPNPEYYLEISHKINCPPEKCLMAGNDTIEDLNASQAGMATYLVDDFILQRSKEEPISDYRGNLKDLESLINSMEI